MRRLLSYIKCIIVYKVYKVFYFRPSKVTEHVTSQFSDGEFKTKQKKPNPKYNPSP